VKEPWTVGCVSLRRLPRFSQTGLPFFTSFKTSSSVGTLPKAYHFVIGFVANIGASLEEFAVDVRAILELTINSK
jgi:hypothetical protein